MREILFKAKREDNGEWVEGYFCKAKYYRTEKELFCWITVPHPESDYLPSDKYMVCPETVCQYTGLVDKNGNKIWENDILQVDKQYSKGVYKVKWVDGAFEYTSLKDGYSFAFDDSYFHLNPDYCEVIGNIFDNPELMGV